MKNNSKYIVKDSHSTSPSGTFKSQKVVLTLLPTLLTSSSFHVKLQNMGKI